MNENPKGVFLSLAPDGAPMVDGLVDPISFAMHLSYIAKVNVKENGFRCAIVNDKYKTWRDVLLEIAEINPKRLFRIRPEVFIYRKDESE